MLAWVLLTSTPTVRAEDRPAVTKLDEIVITATKTPHTLKDVPVETVVVTAEEIEKTNAQNAMDVLKDIPGISVANHDDVFGSYTWRAPSGQCA
jgi:outer membrane receptor for ferrienterochelin and colicins